MSDEAQAGGAETWQAAVAAHGDGRLDEAAELYRAVLDAQPENGEAHYNYGILLFQQGDQDGAVTHLSSAVEHKPEAKPCWLAYGEVLLAAGRARAAETAMEDALERFSPDDERLNELLRRASGLATRAGDDLQAELDTAIDAYRAGDLGAAEAKAREIADRWPADAGGWAVLGAVRAASGRTEAAVEAYNAALSREPNDLETLNNLGNALHALGRSEDAVATFRRALNIQPESALLHYNLGRALHGDGQLRDAQAAYRTAVAQRPGFVAALANLGSVLNERGFPADAETAHREALRHDATSVAANSGLLEVLEKGNRLDELRDALASAREHLGEGDPWVALADARLARRDGRYAEARERLEAVESDNPRFLEARAFALAGICDRLHDADAAMAYADAGNRLAAGRYQARGVSEKPFLARMDACAARFTRDWVASWSEATADDGRADPVFLVGFPRSGTTLLDTVLDAHPAIHAADETQALNAAALAVDEMEGGYPDALADLDDETVAYLREVYFAELDAHFVEQRGAVPARGDGALVVDKLPLNMVDAGLIQRLFPNARVVFMLRHPFDCVLSAYMNDFAPNGAMANFLDLNDSVAFYDRVMRLWEQYRDVLDLPVTTVRYEELVESFDATVAGLLDFLGVSWDERVREHARTAGERGRISTPSYLEVTQPVHARSRERWRRYEAHLAPVAERLLPWVRHYGYAGQ